MFPVTVSEDNFSKINDLSDGKIGSYFSMIREHGKENVRDNLNEELGIDLVKINVHFTRSPFNDIVSGVELFFKTEEDRMIFLMRYR